MARLPFARISDNVLEVGKGSTPLQKAVSGDTITSGTLTAEIWSRGDTPAKVGDTITLTHQGSPAGYWSGPVADDHAAVASDGHVLVKLSINGGAGFALYMELDGVVETKKGDTVT